MAGNILKVKINIPPLSTGTLKRPNILEKLEEGLHLEGNFARPLTLVSAPAGSGKTTLARKWLSGREERAAWFSLNEGDNEPARFWRYFISALQTREKNMGKGSLEMLRYLVQGAEPPGESETLLTPLLNDLFALEEAFILVLDDYHHITDPRIQKDMTFFIENLPPKLHLLVTTRSDPPWPMPRWRARGKMKEIRHSDLKFSREETSYFFNEVKGIGLAESQLNSLYNKTEGWITGLQLAAFSLAASENTDEFIESFTGSHRHVFHFLSEEVFARQPEPVREFLMQTSIISHLCAPLCNAVTERDDAAEMLAHLQRNQLFAISQDERGEWYRYHSLFADLLLHQLKQYYPGKELELHERASSWFLETDMPGEAIQHALKGKNWEQVAHILHEYLEQIVQTEGPGRLLHCYSNLPAALLEKYPRLRVHKAIISLLRGRSEESGDLLEQAELLGYENKKEQEEFRGVLAAVKAYYHISRHEFSRGLEKAEEALKLLPSHSSFWRGGVAIFSGDARLFSGNPKSAYPFYLEALRNSQQYGNYYLHLTSGFKVANVLNDLGRLQESEELTAKVLRTAEEKGLSVVPRAGLLLTLQGELLREKGRLEEAEHWIERGITISMPEKISLGWNYLFKTALCFSKQEYGAALEAVKKIKELDQELGLPQYIMFPAASWEARILFELGNFYEAKEVLFQAGISEETEIAGGYEWGLLSLSRLLLSEERNIARTRKLLNRIEEFAVPGGNQRLLLEILQIKAVLEEKAGKAEAAEYHLLKALQKGKEAGYFQVFLDGGTELVPVYARIIQCSGDEPTKKEIVQYARNIYQGAAQAAGTGGEKENHQAGQQEADGQGLVEKLSWREMEILELLAAGLSNQDISQKLFISVGTVKWYTSNIYGKLGVRGRTQAVTLARKLNLIS